MKKHQYIIFIFGYVLIMAGFSFLAQFISKSFPDIENLLIGILWIILSFILYNVTDSWKIDSIIKLDLLTSLKSIFIFLILLISGVLGTMIGEITFLIIDLGGFDSILTDQYVNSLSSGVLLAIAPILAIILGVNIGYIERREKDIENDKKEIKRIVNR
jgi:hypothetical protein